MCLPPATAWAQAACSTWCSASAAVRSLPAPSTPIGGSGQVVAVKSGEDRVKTHELNEAPTPRAEEKYAGCKSCDPFAPCYKGLSDEEAHCEAGRCLRCDALSNMEIL